MDEATLKAVVTAAVKEAFDEQQKEIIERLEKHDQTLYGNGKPGLVTIVYQLQQTIGKGQGMWDDVVKYVLIAIVAGVIVLIVQHGITP